MIKIQEIPENYSAESARAAHRERRARMNRRPAPSVVPLITVRPYSPTPPEQPDRPEPPRTIEEMRKMIPKTDVRVIQELVAAKSGVPLEVLTGTSRKSAVAWPRQIVFYFCRTLTKRSYIKIGAMCSVDHTTVMYGFRKVEFERARNFPLNEQLTQLEAELKPALKALRSKRINVHG